MFLKYKRNLISLRKLQTTVDEDSKEFTRFYATTRFTDHFQQLSNKLRLDHAKEGSKTRSKEFGGEEDGQ